MRDVDPRWERQNDDHDLATVRGVLSTVEALQEASSQASSWMEPGTCHTGTSNANPCQVPACIARAVRYSGWWAYEAAHQAHRLQALVAGTVRREAC